MTLDEAPLYHDVADGPEGGVAHWLHTDDGTRIRVAHWPLAQARGTVLLFPGRTEYVEKYGRGAADLAARGYATMTIDWRGQGLADRMTGNRDVGHVGVFDDYQRDVRAMIGAAHELALPKPWFLLGHSMGGCIGLRALYQGLPVQATAFTGPMWGIKFSALMRPAAWAIGWGSRKLGQAKRLAPGTKALTYVLAEPFAGNNLTHDPAMYRYMQKQMRDYPEMALGGPSLHWVHEALLETRALAALQSPAMPCITFLGDQERIVDTAAIQNRMARWRDATLVMVPGGEHEVLMELPEMRDMVYDRACALFDRHLAMPDAG